MIAAPCSALGTCDVAVGGATAERKQVSDLVGGGASNCLVTECIDIRRRRRRRKRLLDNYQPVSLTSVLGKVLEKSLNNSST